MSATISVRPARPEDVPRLQEVNADALRDVDAYAKGITDGDLTEIETVYRDPGGAFLVGELDGEVVAMGALKPVGTDTWKVHRIVRPEDGPAAELTRMRVAPDYQRRGYGSTLLESLEERATELGFTVILLDTTARQTGARALYESFGYRLVDAFDWREYEVVMYRKVLPENHTGD